MIDAAERLVAEKGLAALTVQAVQDAAGQRNKSAVQYHFGGRDGLVRALLAARMDEPNQERTAMLLDLGSEPTTARPGRGHRGPPRRVGARPTAELLGPLPAPSPERPGDRPRRPRRDGRPGAAGGTGGASKTCSSVCPRRPARCGCGRWWATPASSSPATRSACSHRGLARKRLVTELVDACCGLVDAPTTAFLDASTRP